MKMMGLQLRPNGIILKQKREWHNNNNNITHNKGISHNNEWTLRKHNFLSLVCFQLLYPGKLFSD